MVVLYVLYGRDMGGSPWCTWASGICLEIKMRTGVEVHNLEGECWDWRWFDGNVLF